MTFTPEWILGAIMTLMLAVIGYQFKLYADLAEDIEHIKDNYVRRDDHTDKIASIEKGVAELRADQKETNKMLVSLLVAVGKQTH